jgi:hypothetical protein
MSNKPLVYTIGPITGCSYGNSTDWRDYAAKNIDPQIEILSPMRHKEYLSQESSIAAAYESHVMSCAKGITTRDRMDCMRSNMVIANFLGATKVSIGSVMEIAWADSARIPIVLVIDKDNLHQHPMITECAGFIVNTLNEGLTVIERTLLAKLSADSMTHRLSQLKQAA